MAQRRTSLWAISAVVVLLVTLLALPIPGSQRIKASVRENFAPFQSVLGKAGARVRDSLSILTGVGAAAAERRDALARIAELNERVRRLHQFERENEELRRQSGFAKKAPYRLVLCEVIGRDVSGWWQTVRLNRGSAQGIGRDMPVIAIEGLVGRVKDVTLNTADVLLISDPACMVSCTFAKAGGFGIVKGGGSAAQSDVQVVFTLRPARMSFVENRVEIQNGDEVLTSGLGGIYPPGLLVGYVETAGLDSSGLYQWADVAPAADIRALQYVFVMVKPGTAQGNGS